MAAPEQRESLRWVSRWEEFDDSHWEIDGRYNRQSWMKLRLPVGDQMFLLGMKAVTWGVARLGGPRVAPHPPNWGQCVESLGPVTVE